MYAAIRRYEGVADIAEVKRQVTEEFLPLIRQLPGFVAFYLVDGGDGVVISTSVFEGRAEAEESTRHGAQFVRDHLASLFPNAPQVTAGEILTSG